jgi:hypothetical protein
MSTKTRDRLKRFGRFLLSAVPAALVTLAAAYIWRIWEPKNDPMLGIVTFILGFVALSWFGDEPEPVDEPTPDTIRLAITDPGAYVDRGPDSHGERWGEPLVEWQTRAVTAAATGQPTLVDLADESR